MSRAPRHRHRTACYEASSIPTCGVAAHEHLLTTCYDEHQRLTCRRAEHRHVKNCYDVIPMCGQDES